MQRALDEGRAESIKDYLLQNNERFFNSMIVAVYDGDPEWYEIGNISADIESEDIECIPEDVVDALGILRFSGKEKFFALDGQHRLFGIIKALKEKEELGKEEISVIFVAHQDNAVGLRRSRRLFTTLNKTAKPVVKREIIALDEDDTMAIITRRLLEENKLFKGDRVCYEKVSSLQHTNLTSITTIENLYDVIDILLRKVLYEYDVKTLTYNRLKDEELDALYVSVCGLFNSLFKMNAALKEYNTNKYTEAVTKYRHKEGGNVFYRPIGWLIMINVMAELTNKYDLKKSLELLMLLPDDFSELPFRGIVWNPAKKVILTKGRGMATRLLLYMLGISKGRTDLLTDYRAALGEGFEKAILPNKLV
jgi:DNA sulfur modification protein DndB